MQNRNKLARNRYPWNSLAVEWAYTDRGLIVAFITFVSSWIYCIATYGFLLGVGLGWLASLIVAIFAFGLAVLLWGPLALVLSLLVLYVVFRLLMFF
jgi:hypothetical protein